MRSPNFVIAGANKCGTTSLFSHLSQHPGICASDVKEVSYFAPLRYGREPGPWEEYLAHWPAGATAPVLMEASAGYVYGGRRTAEAMARRLPGCRVLLVLRDPVDRARSFFAFQKSRLTLPPDLTFEEYVRRAGLLDSESLARQECNPWWGIRGGEYVRFLPPWLDIFGENVSIRFFDDLRSDAEAFTKSVTTWLGLDPHIAWDLRRENETAGYRSRAVQRLALSLNDGAEAWWRSHPRTKRLLRAGYQRLNRAPADNPDDATVAILTEHFAPWNAALSDLLAGPARSSPLPSWLVGKDLENPPVSSRERPGPGS